MQHELEYEFNQFLIDMKNGETFCTYFDEDEYEYNYSHNELEEYRQKFEDKIGEWLMQNKPGEYIILNGYCILVITIDEAIKRNIY